MKIIMVFFLDLERRLFTQAFRLHLAPRLSLATCTCVGQASPEKQSQ